MNSKANEVLKNTPIISVMIDDAQVKHVIDNLDIVLKDEIKGDVVELGCNVGTTSIFIRKLLNQYSSKKEFLVYDSFEGLPPKQAEDEALLEEKQYKEGSCKTSLERFQMTFEQFKLEEPTINIGWFKEIPNEKYPKEIAFAFFDGDFYSSIIDSFEKVYPKLSKGARVIIHDYAWPPLPGVKKACDDFLQDKPEKVIQIGHQIGLLIKE